MAKMRLLVVDFETYWDVDYTLKKLNTSDYVFDPRFEVIGVSVIDVVSGQRYWMEEHQWRAFTKMVDWSKISILCHHTHFDGLIMAHYYGIKPYYWFDTMSMARAIHGAHKGASLEFLMEMYGVGMKGKYVLETKGMHRGDFTPEQYAAYGEYSINDSFGTFEIFKKMYHALPKVEYDLIDRTIRMYTEPVFVLDQTRMTQFLADEIKRKAELLLRCGADKKVLGSNDKFAALLREFAIDPPMKNSPKKKHEDGTPVRVYAFAKTDPGMQQLLEHEEEEVRFLAEARVAIKSAGNESRTARMLKLGEGGRPMPVYLKYATAGPWRWGGTDGRNWQNFEKPNKSNPLKGIIRKSIMAPPGMRVIAADASQIEARFNGWHNRQDDLTAQFANGEDVYSLFASEAYGRPVDRKKVKEDETPGQVGKICVLGLGYNMGWLKLGLELLMGRGGAPRVQFTREYIDMLGIDVGRFLANPRNIEQIRQAPCRLNEVDRMIHFAVANHFVEVYRRKNNMITSGWKYLNDEVIPMLYQGTFVGTKIGRRGILTIVEDGIMAPGGQVIKYPYIEYKDKQFSYLAGRGQRSKLYGGLMTENLTQFLCRCIIGDAIVKLTWGRVRAGLEPYHVAMTEHDAIACVEEADRAQECYDDLIRAISVPPEWAPDLPLAAEGGIGDSYGTAK